MICRLLMMSCAALALLLTPQSGRAWGIAGHAIVADIAEWHLTPAALDQVHLLLADEGLDHLDQVASWPDMIRKERPEASPWHYVGIPLTASRYDAARDCAKGDCVVDAINRYVAILSDRGQPVAARREALKFLVHFIGDIQQPLHGADNEGDHGGNKVPVQFFDETRGYGGSAPLNLHALWDGGIIDHHLGVKEGPLTAPNNDLKVAATLFAATLNGKISKAEAAAPQNLDPAVWAQESHDLAVRVVYPGVVAPGAQPPEQPVKLGAAYDRRAWPVVERRLTQGGLRLAAVLNKALG